MYVGRSYPTLLHRQKQWLHILSCSKELDSIMIPTHVIGVAYTYFWSTGRPSKLKLTKTTRQTKPKA